MVICCTGHRPSPDRYPGDPATLKRLEDLAFDYLVGEMPDVLVTGMALGWDQACARAALALGIEVHAYIPFMGQADRWTKRQCEEYSAILHRCVRKIIVSPGGYSPAKFQRRNEAMVDACDSVLAFWDGGAGGTGNCMAYADMMGVPVTNLWEQWKP